MCFWVERLDWGCRGRKFESCHPDFLSRCRTPSLPRQSCRRLRLESGISWRQSRTVVPNCSVGQFSAAKPRCFTEFSANRPRHTVRQIHPGTQTIEADAGVRLRFASSLQRASDYQLFFKSRSSRSGDSVAVQAGSNESPFRQSITHRLKLVSIKRAGGRKRV